MALNFFLSFLVAIVFLTILAAIDSKANLIKGSGKAVAGGLYIISVVGLFVSLIFIIWS